MPEAKQDRGFKPINFKNSDHETLKARATALAAKRGHTKAPLAPYVMEASKALEEKLSKESRS